MDHIMSTRQNVIQKFLSEYVPELINIVESYLNGKISHGQIYDYTCDVIDSWHKLGDVINKEVYEENEEQFWAILWTTQVLASERHWKDGLPQKELPVLLNVIKKSKKLPKGYEGKRPCQK